MLKESITQKQANSKIEEYLYAEQFRVVSKTKQSVIPLQAGYYENGIEKSDTYSLEQMYAFLLSKVQNPFIILKDHNSYDDEKNNILFFEIVCDSSASANLKMNFFKKINEKNLKDVPKQVIERTIRNLVDTAEINKDYIELLFKNGYRVKDSNEIGVLSGIESELCATGCLEFFEILFKYQPEFNIDKKYKVDSTSQNTLLEMLEEDYNSLSSTDKKGYFGKKAIALIELFKDVKKIQMYGELNKDLPIKSQDMQVGTRIKI